MRVLLSGPRLRGLQERLRDQLLRQPMQRPLWRRNDHDELLVFGCPRRVLEHRCAHGRAGHGDLHARCERDPGGSHAHGPAEPVWLTARRYLWRRPNLPSRWHSTRALLHRLGRRAQLPPRSPVRSTPSHLYRARGHAWVLAVRMWCALGHLHGGLDAVVRERLFRGRPRNGGCSRSMQSGPRAGIGLPRHHQRRCIVSHGGRHPHRSYRPSGGRNAVLRSILESLSYAPGCGSASVSASSMSNRSRAVSSDWPSSVSSNCSVSSNSPGSS